MWSHMVRKALVTTNRSLCFFLIKLFTTVSGSLKYINLCVSKFQNSI